MHVKIFFESIAKTMLLILLTATLIVPMNVFAMTEEQRQVLDLGIPYYNVGGNCVSSSGSVDSFVKSPIDSTWEVPDDAVEEWFLKKGSKTIAKFNDNLNSSNIRTVTNLVREIGVSPVFFYTYAITEGGGLGGFINHYGRNYYANNGGNTFLNAAKGDAEYIVAQSQKTTDKPAWQDLGTSSGNGNFVPQDVQNAGNADFESMPTGTIGRIIIPATAAATWGTYYPDGLKKEVNGVQTYGNPIESIQKFITELGGDPAKGGGDPAKGCESGSGVSLDGINPDNLPNPPGGIFNDSRMSSDTLAVARIMHYLFSDSISVTSYIGGSVNTSCHGKWDGNKTISALDLMVKGNIHSAEVRRKLEEISELIMNSRETLKVTTIIYYDKILGGAVPAKPYSQWSSYGHPSGNDDTLAHRDHIHISIAPCNN